MQQCHASQPLAFGAGQNQVALVGHPNVGKSVLFGRLTGRYVAVSNYPGTTVELTHGTAHGLPHTVIIDTPGVLTLPSRTDDEQVTSRVLLNQPLHAIVQVGDAKNLRRTLLLTVQLAEMGIPLVLACNMMDEARVHGIVIDDLLLTASLSVPVIPSIATDGQGVDQIMSALRSVGPPTLELTYAPAVEAVLAVLMPLLPPSPVTPRALALLWLSDDHVAEEWIARQVEPAAYAGLTAQRDATQRQLAEPVTALLQRTRMTFVERLVGAAVKQPNTCGQEVTTRLSRLTTHPGWGLLILGLVLYALYWFVGVFGAGTLVGLFEERLFGELINPHVTAWIERLVPASLVTSLLVGDYGLWTMGITYAVALLLPVVLTFFMAFGVLEDSGYLPRLAVLSNRLFQVIGLNGKAVLPMVLGLGCVTMATITTRTLANPRDRLLVILLLALAVPCSAQLGVVMGMLASISLVATLIWSSVMLLVLLAVGWLAAHLMPGTRSPLLVELPPLRWPRWSNVLIKTAARLEWYLKEALPLFLLGTLIMFALDALGLLPRLIRAGEPLVVGWLGLPAEASAAFLLGFMRRDFGATGLFVLQTQALLDARQVVVAMVTITLFIPCIASVIMIARERGVRTATAITALVFPLAFLIGGLLNRLLLLAGWGA